MEDARAQVTVFCGPYGSGKTEIAINYALRCAASGGRVWLIDLDVVTPYFRSRDAADALLCTGVKVVAPTGRYAQADLPSVPPGTFAALSTPDEKANVVVDTGGDPAGARILGSIRERFGKSVEVLVVLNAARPFTRTACQMAAETRRIEESSHLPITGVVSNTHLGEYTDLSVIKNGYREAELASHELLVPVKFVAARFDLAPDVEREVGVPVLPLKLHMLLPWS